MYSIISETVLERPEHLGGEFWQAIDDAFQRAKRAQVDGDMRLLIGSAKDLVESVARSTLSALGDPQPNDADYGGLVRKAHARLAKQPGLTLADDSIVGQSAHASRSLATSLAGLRNRFGTGHGRATLEELHDEVVEMSVFGALLWSRWALRRLDIALQGAIEPLIADLRNGATFYSEILAFRLRSADLASRTKEDQLRLGVAVGQRAAMDTMTVTADGVAACAEESDLDRWPVAYRLGVVEGLILDAGGYLRVGHAPLALNYAADILAMVPAEEQAEFAAALSEKVLQAGWSPRFQAVRLPAAAAFRTGAHRLSEPAREVWESMPHFLERVVD